VKVNALLDRVEDPRQVLDYSYARQQELLIRIRRAIIDVAAARSRAAVQESQLRNSADRLRQQAQQAVAADREELARQALALRTATLAQADDLATEQAALRADEERLSGAVHRLHQKAEAFRVHKETLKAHYTAAQAAASAGLALGGVSEEMSDVDLATRRAEDTIARLQARADAVDDTLASGSPADMTGLASDQDIQAQLDAVTTQAAVQRELAAIKDQLAAQTRQPPDSAGRRRAAGPRTPPERHDERNTSGG